MEAFFNLPEIKQYNIINAALEAFGNNGYKKTSVSDIASAAGISKAMIFHYFGTKKELYLYLLSYCWDIVTDEMNKKLDKSVTDLFDRILMASDIKISVMKKHPALLSFMTNAYYETDKEVEPDIREHISINSDKFNTADVMSGIDYSRFKESIDTRLVIKMLIYFSEGCINEAVKSSRIDIDLIMKEVTECVEIMKGSFYKDA